MRALALLSLLALAACGQKGNLYLPDEDPEAVPATITPVVVSPVITLPGNPAAAPATPAATTPAPDADDDSDDDTQRN